MLPEVESCLFQATCCIQHFDTSCTNENLLSITRLVQQSCSVNAPFKTHRICHFNYGLD